jgi:hypothetical protein
MNDEFTPDALRRRLPTDALGTDLQAIRQSEAEATAREQMIESTYALRFPGGFAKGVLLWVIISPVVYFFSCMAAHTVTVVVYGPMTDPQPWEYLAGLIPIIGLPFLGRVYMGRYRARLAAMRPSELLAETRRLVAERERWLREQEQQRRDDRIVEELVRRLGR